MDEPPTDEEIDYLNTIAGKTKILITTRVEIPDAEETYDLSEIDEDSALILFYRHYRKGRKFTIDQIREQRDVPFAKKIIAAARKNALLIELIGKMSYTDHWKLDDLWKRLEADVFGQDSKHFIPTSHGKSHHRDKDSMLGQIHYLYEMSGLSNTQKDIMYFIALFPAEHSIFFDVFEWAGFEDDEVDDLGELERRGWIERGDEGYLIHTMVQGSVKLQSGKVKFDEERYENLIDELADTDQYISKGTVYTKVRERIVVPETVCELLTDNGSEKKNTARLFNNMAGVYHHQGNYEKAMEYYEKALVIKEKVLGKEHPDTATTYNNIALVYKAQGNYEKALEYYEKALVIKEKVLGKEHPSTATTYNNIALVYKAQGNYEKAMDYYEKDRIISEKVLGREHPSTATTYNNIAGVYEDQGNYEKALEYYEKALAIQEKVLGKEHPDTATTYHNMAGVYEDQGNYEKALDYYEKALVISEKVLGKEHPSTATTYHNIAGVYYAQGNYEKALEYYEKVLAIQEKVLGREHPSTATTYNNIALVFYTQGNYEKAFEFFWKAVKILYEKLGSEHPYTKSARRNLEITKKALTNN